MGGVCGVDQLTSLSLHTRVEVELGCDNLSQVNEISAEVGGGWPGLDSAGEGGHAGQWGSYKVG